MSMTIALAQIAPVWLNRAATLAKVDAAIQEAARGGATLVSFGEALVPGYPFWIELTDGARFESATQKALFSHYSDQAVVPSDGHLDDLCKTCRMQKIACYLGIIERASDRSGHSLYASLVYIDATGEIGSIHRKLVPTYEERLVWAPGDGAGLRTHTLGPFTVGALNCWENWMPLSRAALYAQGEDLHVAVWPGNRRNTEDITRFMAREGRSYVASVSALMRPSDIDPETPHASAIAKAMPAFAANGGSMLVGPDAGVLIEPIREVESVTLAEIHPARVREERQNFDPTGHYSRPDVISLKVNRNRQSVAEFDDGN